MDEHDEHDFDIGKLPPPLPVDASAPPPDDLPTYDHVYRKSRLNLMFWQK